MFPFVIGNSFSWKATNFYLFILHDLLTLKGLLKTLKKIKPVAVQEKNRVASFTYIPQLSWDMKEVDALFVTG